MRYRKGKLGLSDFMKNKDNTNLVSGVANNLSGVVSALDANNDSVGGSVASSALSGLSMGMQTGNPIAAGVGLVGGGLYGLFSAQKKKKDQFNAMVSKDENNKVLSASNTAIQYNNNASLRGDRNAGYYASGGMIKRADGSSSKRGLWDNIRANKGSGKKPTTQMLKKEKKIRKMALGGHLQKITNQDSLVVGKSHEQGGVKFPEHGVELEGGETVNNNFVFSKQLGFADKHLKLIKQKSKFEDLAKVRVNDKSLINSIKFTDEKIERLKGQQEELKESLGMENDSEEMARGGLLFTKDDLLRTSYNKDNIPTAKLLDYNFSKSNISPISNIFEGEDNKSTTKQINVPKGDSIAVSHNNPRNIKFGSFAKQFGATEGRKATDGGSFAYFPNVETGLEAGKSLMKGRGYRDLTVDLALRKWSNNGYGDNLVPELKGKKIKDLSEGELNELTKRQIKMEDGKMYAKLYGKYTMGGYLKGALGLTPEEIRIKKMQIDFAKKTRNKDYKQLEEQREKEAFVFGQKENIRIDKEIQKRRTEIENNRKNRFSKYKKPNIDISNKLKAESTGVNNNRYGKINNVVKANGVKIENPKRVISNNSMEKSLAAYKSAQTLDLIKNQYDKISNTVSRRIDEGTQNLKNTGRKISNFFGDLVPDTPKNSSGGANPITGQQYNQNKNNLLSIQQNKQIEKILDYNKFNQNNISTNDGSQSRPDIRERNDLNKPKNQIKEKTTQKRKSVGNIPDKKSQVSNISTTTSNIPTTAGGDRFNIKPSLFDSNKDYSSNIKPLSKDELANQRKGQIRMLSDEELANNTNKRKGLNIDKEELLNGINTFGSDVAGLLRKYPNVPNPILDSNIRLQKQNANGELVQNNQDFNNALTGTGNLSANVSAGIRGNLLASKLRANNDVNQRLMSVNTDIGNRESLINSSINQGNNQKLNQFNQDTTDRDYAIGNNRQDYINNISSKMLQQSRDKKLDDLDVIKLGIYSSMVDKGVRNKVNGTMNITEEQIQKNKKMLGLRKFGGKIKF